jgi:release factor glutamine methyltransferase
MSADRGPTATIAQVLASVERRFADAGIPTARSEARILVSAATGESAESLLIHPTRALTADERQQIDALAARRARREPLPYVIGEAEFYSLRFRVTPSVIVPRPETEVLAEAAVERARLTGARLAVDVGTGCGAVSIVMAREVIGLRVMATDISMDALRVADENRRRYDVESDVLLTCGDLLGPVRATADCIVANLPYVRADEFAELQPEVRDFEPRVALDGGPDGLAHIRRLSVHLRRHLSPGGFAALEVGAGQAAEAAKLLLGEGLTEIDVIADYSGVARVVIGRRRE